MTVDEVRRAWLQAAEEAGVQARLVALGRVESDGTPMRGRTAASWTARVRFEGRLAELLGDEAGSFDLQWLAPSPREAGGKDRARARLGMAPRPEGPMEVGQLPPGAKPAPKPVRKPVPVSPTAVPGAKHVIAVASGKGGVGKSTVSVNLAAALSARGLKVGLLDADVYGPSMPTMLGSFTAPTRNGEIFNPPEAHGLSFLSLGLMVNPDQSVIWRGPLIQRMVRDMLQKTAWPDLDVLVIDLPPGTGDVQLTLVQRALLDGAVVVSTPQDIALIDAARALDMFKKMNVKVLGIVENMASFACASCGVESHPFGTGGAETQADRLGIPFLGRIPMEETVREGCDSGAPAVFTHPNSASSKAFADLAERIADLIVVAP